MREEGEWMVRRCTRCLMQSHSNLGRVESVDGVKLGATTAGGTWRGNLKRATKAGTDGLVEPLTNPCLVRGVEMKLAPIRYAPSTPRGVQASPAISLQAPYISGRGTYRLLEYRVLPYASSLYIIRETCIQYTTHPALGFRTRYEVDISCHR